MYLSLTFPTPTTTPTTTINPQAYLKVAPQVAAMGPEYRHALATHLVKVKARHWDKALRELAAQAAAALVPYYPSYFAGPALEELLPACLDEQLEVGKLERDDLGRKALG